MKPNETRGKSVSPGEVIVSEGFIGLPAMYLIKEGQVEIFVIRDDKRIVLSTLGKGQFFGEDVLLGPNPRSFTAKAITYCELQVFPAEMLKAAVDKMPALVRHMLGSLIQTNARKDEALAQHENLQTHPDFLTYAHVLKLMVATAGRRHGEELATLPVADAVNQCREVTGHTRRHAAGTLKRMALLNLVTLEGHHGATDPSIASILGDAALKLRFNPSEIVPRARELARHQMDSEVRREQELIELDELATLTGVERSLLLRKLASGEIADALFNFRRTEVLRYVAEKGRDYFAKRPRNAPLQCVSDLISVDTRTLFEALRLIDEFDLARLLDGIHDSTLRDKLLSCVGKAKREEVEALLTQGLGADPEAVQHIEEQLLETVRLLRQPAAPAAAVAAAREH